MKHHILSKIIVAAIALQVSLVGAEAQQSTVQTYGSGHRTVLHSRMGLSGSQDTAYRKFTREGGYFGAFSANEGGQIDCWFHNMHSLVTARQFALGCCRIYAERDGVDPDGCVLYASIIPTGLDPHNHTAAGLSENGLTAFGAKYLAAQKPGRYGAFAISGMSQWASTAGRDNEADAVGSAIAACEASADRAVASYSNDTRRRINQQGRTECKVIHVTRP